MLNLPARLVVGAVGNCARWRSRRAQWCASLRQAARPGRGGQWPQLQGSIPGGGGGRPRARFSSGACL